MADLPHNPELLKSLARLVRGLSALFWGLPLALIVCFHTFKAESIMRFGIVPPIVSTAVLVYALWLLGGFQPQERIWAASLDRARLLALLNLGLSPFLYWCNRVPNSGFFNSMVLLMIFSALLFLASLNQVLQRLGAMLPDETLRHDVKHFTNVNLQILLTTLGLAVLYLVAGQLRNLPNWLALALAALDEASFSLLILLVLLPMALTMALVWKTKEVILDNVFGTHHSR